MPAEVSIRRVFYTHCAPRGFSVNNGQRELMCAAVKQSSKQGTTVVAYMHVHVPRLLSGLLVQLQYVVISSRWQPMK